MDCLRTPEMSYSDWSASLHKKALEKRIPISGSLELTFRCNNNCIHCYCNVPAFDKEEISKEMDSDRITGLISEIADEGCLWLLLTGGEPLLRPDFKEIYLHSKKRGMIVTLFTNGTLIDEKMADFLGEWKPFSIEITLYGATEKTYDAVTRTHGSYQQCMRGIELLIERKIPLKLKTMAIKQNVAELPLIKQYAENRNVEFKFDPVVNARLDMGRGSFTARLDPEAVVRLDIEDEKRLKEWKEVCRNMSYQESDRLYTCGAGVTDFHIDPYGNLSICIMARKDIYNLKAGNFTEGWYNFIERVKTRTQSNNNKCRGCDLMAICSQCPGWAQLEHGDDESPVDYLCEITHKRAAAFGLE